MLLSELVVSSFSPMHRCTARARQTGSGSETPWPSRPRIGIKKL
jgi:hypothetical protein